jgi:flagella basal body P-ring formation protein FlgA
MMLPALLLAAAACIPVEGDRILAADLAPALPALAALPADTPLAYAPVPGVRRVLLPAELRRLGARHGVELRAAPELCVERPMETLDRERVLAALRRSLAIPEARIDIVELSRQLVPRGALQFPRERLSAPPLRSANAAVLWKGYVLYGSRRRFTVWARVRISAPLQRIVAAGDLPAGQPLEESRLRVERFEGFPLRREQAQTLEQVLGRVPRRSIPAGSAVWLNQLDELPDIRRGDTIAIEVRSGAARLSSTGRAESAGSRGQTIAVRNPESNKTFAARVVGKGKAVVTAGGGTP